MSLTEHEVEARQDAEHDAEYEGRGPIHCPACGQHGCDLLRGYGKGTHADYECGCGWRFRADRQGTVLREFGFAVVAAPECPICQPPDMFCVVGEAACAAALPDLEALSV